jgi:hypothetical protein
MQDNKGECKYMVHLRGVLQITDYILARLVRHVYVRSPVWFDAVERYGNNNARSVSLYVCKQI